METAQHEKLSSSQVPEFADKGCEKTFTVKGNMVEHTFKCKFNPDGVHVNSYCLPYSVLGFKHH